MVTERKIQLLEQKMQKETESDIEEKRNGGTFGSKNIEKSANFMNGNYKFPKMQ